MFRLPKTTKRPASRRHYAQLIRRVLELAVYPCRIRIHNTRTTFITLALANGATGTIVQDRTGHRSSQQINGYRQGARLAAELSLGPLAPRHAALGLDARATTHQARRRPQEKTQCC
jgi:integrase